MTKLTRSSTLALFLTGAVSLSAQTAAPAAKTTATAHHTATVSSVAHKPVTASVCAKDVPVLSPKIPALLAGAACAKPLYTITTEPQVKLENISPLENPDIAKILGIERSSFSLLYIDTKVGTGEIATPHKYYSVHYTGYLLDGTKFDSSLDRGEPITFNPEQHNVIPGWFTGFDGMHVGGKRRLFVPYQLAYGATAHGPIPAKSELVFDVELVSLSDSAPAPKAPPTPPARPAMPAPATPSATTPSAAQPATPAAVPTPKQ
jgi:peptidylprolyl isomerase